MTKTELIAAVAKKSGLTQKDTDKALAAALDVITCALSKGDKVQLTGFGTFEVREKAAREGRNPRTGKKMKIKASRIPKFKAGRALKDAVK